jgi:tRNA pseudouridine38-40 synthase
MTDLRLKITVEYDGTDFSGWQVQPGCRTVQGEFESALEKLTGRRIAVTGAGRTDAGVHAAGQVVHMDILDSERDRMESGLDSILPDDLSILCIEEVALGFHARFHAVSRTYVYNLAKKRHPLSCRYEHVLHSGELDSRAMQLAAQLSTGEHDWRAMAREGSGNKTWLADVSEAAVEETVTGWTLLISANRFLRGMVRIWSGSLVQTGLGKKPPGVIEQMFETGDRGLAGPSLPANGLTLLKVRYD